MQVGPPAELYRRPATRWLAGFVGDANLLAGTARGDHADTVLGAIALHEPFDGEVEVLVRPEELSVEPAGSAGASPGLEATVELVEFVGHDTTYLVRAGDVSLQVRRSSMPVVGRGDPVVVRWTGDSAASFPVA